MKRLEEMLNTLLMGWVYDVQSISEQIANDKTEEGKKSAGHYIIRLQLSYFAQYQLFRSNFSERRDEQPPSASQMFGVADVLYSLYYHQWMREVIHLYYGIGVGDGQSYRKLSVDTDCLQLLANAQEPPPPERASRRQQCRQQLWVDVLQRSPRLPVTSYLAYTQRANVNLCHLARMAAFSLWFCQDVVFVVSEFLRYARCYFDDPDHKCLQSNATDAVCHVLRAILVGCYYSDYQLDLEPHEAGNRSRSETLTLDWTDFTKEFNRPSSFFWDNPHAATLKFKDFKVENLQQLEISFIAVNIFFRVLSVGLYAYLPHLRNLPGKILLSFQTTGLVQVLFTELLYRMAGVPDLSTTVLVDSALTLLGCLWLNTFCYHMYGCVRHLRLPNDLQPFEVKKIFRRLVLCALIPCSIVCAITTGLEKTGKYYLLPSRVIFLLAISTSILLNMVFLILLLYMYLHTRKSMRQLNIYNEEKFASKKQILYMSVKTVILSGIGVIIRIGFHQVEDIAQFVYYVHVATMMQGPVFFVFFICNGTTLPVLRNRALKLWNPNIIIPGQELCSSAEINLARKRNELSHTAESSL